MYCRGEERRKEIVMEYDLKPIAHVRLLNNKTIISGTGSILKDSYYCFAYKKKNVDKEYTKTFFCGSHAAKHFIKLTNSKDIPLFDPLKSNSPHNGGAGSGGGSGTRNRNKTNKQLYDAINLIIICWGVIPANPLVSIKEKIEKYYYNEPFLSEVKSINTMLKKDFKKRTLSQMIKELKDINKEIRSFDFSLLNKMLEDNNIESFFG